MNRQSIDIDKVIKRLKEKLGFKYDAELAREIGIKPTYLGKKKSEGDFTGSIWNKILILCNRKKLNINDIVFGRRVSYRAEMAEDFRSELEEIQKQVVSTIEKYE